MQNLAVLGQQIDDCIQSVLRNKTPGNLRTSEEDVDGIGDALRLIPHKSLPAPSSQLQNSRSNIHDVLHKSDQELTRSSYFLTLIGPLSCTTGQCFKVYHQQCRVDIDMLFYNLICWFFLILYFIMMAFLNYKF